MNLRRILLNITIVFYIILVNNRCIRDPVGIIVFKTVKKFIIPDITSDVDMDGYKNGYINITNMIFYTILYEITNYTYYTPYISSIRINTFYFTLKPIFSLKNSKISNIIFSEGVLFLDFNEDFSIRSIENGNFIVNREISNYKICGYLTNKDKIYPIYYQYCGIGEESFLEILYNLKYYINDKEGEQVIESICEYDFDSYWVGLYEEEEEILNNFTNIIKRKKIKLTTKPNPIKLIEKEIKRTNENEYIVKIKVEYTNEVDVRWLSSLPEYKGYPVLMYTWRRNNPIYSEYDSSELIKDIVKTTNGWTNTIELWIRDITNNNGGTLYYEGVANDLFGMVVISDKNNEKICLGVPIGR